MEYAFKIKVNLEGEIIMLNNDRIIGKGLFYNGKQITITHFMINRSNQRKGYGTFLMNVFKGLAIVKNEPIVLESLVRAMKFYEKMGFVCLRKFEHGSYKGQEVIFDNLNPAKEFECQVGTDDLIWIPPQLKQVSISL